MKLNHSLILLFINKQYYGKWIAFPDSRGQTKYSFTLHISLTTEKKQVKIKIAKRMNNNKRFTIIIETISI